jgi:hypothetical protein
MMGQQIPPALRLSMNRLLRCEKLAEREMDEAEAFALTLLRDEARLPGDFPEHRLGLGFRALHDGHRRGDGFLPRQRVRRLALVQHVVIRQPTEDLLALLAERRVGGRRTELT